MPRERRRRGLVGQTPAELPEPTAVVPVPAPVEPPEPAPTYSEADVPSTAAAAIAWMDAADSDEDHIARAETLVAANAGRAKPWASVSKATASVLAYSPLGGLPTLAFPCGPVPPEGGVTSRYTGHPDPACGWADPPS